MSDPAENPVLALMARQASLAVEIQAVTGCSEVVAQRAAVAYANFPNAPRHGLGDHSPNPAQQAINTSAEIALNAWLAAQARKAA